MRWTLDVVWFHQLHMSLRWRHNGRDGISNHQPHHCLLNRLFGRRSKKTSKLRVTGLCAGISPGTPHKWPVTRKMFPFDDVIMVNPLSVYTTWGEECIFPHPFDNNHQDSNQCITASNSGRNVFFGLHTPYCYTAMNSDDAQQETEEYACKIQHIGGNTLVIGHRVWPPRYMTQHAA